MTAGSGIPKPFHPQYGWNLDLTQRDYDLASGSQIAENSEVRWNLDLTQRDYDHKRTIIIDGV